MITCDNCKGDGRDPYYRLNGSCKKCGGSGQIQEPRKLEIQQGDVNITIQHCDHGLGYISIENHVMETFACIQFTKKNKERIAEFLQSE